MKTFVRLAAVLVGTAVTGILVWRKVESDRHMDGLWAEAEKATADEDRGPAPRRTEPVPAPRG